ncbi:lipoprotein lipase-like isoform X2 [Atheta coriaria]|uniref:lipoprotein lipase-like isoform X2 n=1 Tax=Dalotia coriaria TaxID=877792 RepID=UPI0031F3794D
MNLKLFFVLFLPVALQDTVNNSKLEQYRKDFMKQLLNGISFQLPTLSLSGKKKDSKTSKKTQALADEPVKFYLYTRQYPFNSLVINNNVSLINPKLPVKMLVHGWTEHYYVEWCKKLTAAYLKKGLYNVIVLDWSSRGDADYISASLAVPEISTSVGNFIANRIHRGRKVPLERIHLISHSLGAHVAGLSGQRVIKVLGKPLGRITALDPAAPYFDLFTLQNDDRLSPDDAAFVDIVHTDGGWLGFRQSLGTTDFYPNGGTAVQPGCSLLKADVQYEDFMQEVINSLYDLF